MDSKRSVKKETVRTKQTKVNIAKCITTKGIRKKKEIVNAK
jgi:hypothetical protein